MYNITQQLQIYEFYLGYSLDEFPHTICCPWEDESNPSFSLMINDEHTHISWVKYNEGNLSGGVVEFVMNMEDCDFSSAQFRCRSIIRGSALGFSGEKRNTIKNKKHNLPPNIYINHHYTDKELQYWEKHVGATQQDLIEWDIWSLNSLTYTNSDSPLRTTDRRPKFIYPYYADETKKTVCGWKMYNPLIQDKKRERKWLSGGESQLGNWYNIPREHDYLFICTSKKDGLASWKWIFDRKYPVVYLWGESSIKDLLKLAPQLANYKHKYYLCDYEFEGLDDKGKIAPGLVVAKKIEEKLNIPYIIPDYSEGCKDIADEYLWGDINKLKENLFKFIT